MNVCQFILVSATVFGTQFLEFPEGVFFIAAIQLSRTKDGGTELVLTHRGVPKQLIPSVEQTWRKFYWERIRALVE